MIINTSLDCVLITVVRKMQVPVVSEGRWPILGHAVAMGKNPMAYFRRCYEEYGPIFEINLLGYRMVVVCDRKLYREYTAIDEMKQENKDGKGKGTLSIYKFFDFAYLDNPYIDTSHSSLCKITQASVIRAVADISHAATTDVWHSLQTGITVLVSSINDARGLNESVFRYSVHTCSVHYFGYVPTSSCLDDLYAFSKLMDKLTSNVFTLPRFLAKYWYAPSLKLFQQKILQHLSAHLDVSDHPMILKLKELASSLLFNNSNNANSATSEEDEDNVGSDDDNTSDNEDYDDDNTDGETRDDVVKKFVVGVYLAMVMAGSPNTAMGVTDAIIELAYDNSCLDRVRNEVATTFQRYEECVRRGETCENAGLLNSQLLNNIVWETARLYPSLFGSVRMVTEPNSDEPVMVGPYNVSQAFAVVCMSALITNDSDLFPDPTTFNPDRFSETMGCKYINQIPMWGTNGDETDGSVGVGRVSVGYNSNTNKHACPGIELSTKQMMLAIATIAYYFNVEKSLSTAAMSSKPDINYITTTTFATRNVSLQLSGRI